MHKNDSCPICEVVNRFHEVAITERNLALFERDAAQRERDEVLDEIEVLRAREEGEPWTSAKIRRERDEALARSEKALADLDEAIALIRVIVESDCLQPHAFDRGDDDASVYEACKHLIHRHKQ